MPSRYEINLPKQQCETCRMALGRFLGRLKGVDSIEAEEGKIIINFDEKTLSEQEVARIARETLEKIGHF